jgi:hypothetical protein
MREIAVEGKVRRSEVRSYEDKQGKERTGGNVVLSTEFDKLELGAGMSPSAKVLAQIKALQDGEQVRLLVGVESAGAWPADARFVFLDDLTPRRKS